jgi:hypothetical protein
MPPSPEVVLKAVIHVESPFPDDSSEPSNHCQEWMSTEQRSTVFPQREVESVPDNSKEDKVK